MTPTGEICGTIIAIALIVFFGYVVKKMSER
jgi:flagellar biogenesis protein FliO